MRVICPYTRISPETRAALEASGFAWEPRDVSGSDVAYADLLAELWAAGEDFAIVEHDIIPTTRALATLEACGSDWCSCPFPYFIGLHPGLGCARFTSAVIARHPDLMFAVGAISDDDHPPYHWCRLDARISQVLIGRGERRCAAHPPVGHLSPYPAHGCVPGLPQR